MSEKPASARLVGLAVRLGTLTARVGTPGADFLVAGLATGGEFLNLDEKVLQLLSHVYFMMDHVSDLTILEYL